MNILMTNLQEIGLFPNYFYEYFDFLTITDVINDNLVGPKVANMNLRLLYSNEHYQS